MSSKSSSPTSCAEKGVWTPVPPALSTLSLKTIDPNEEKSISSSGTMSLPMVGCTGNYGDAANTDAVAAATCPRAYRTHCRTYKSIRDFEWSPE